jgi:predicted PurR-regulated permease PerM
MNEIPSLYWMIVLGFVTFFFCLILLYTALLIKESRDTVKESREILKSGRESILKLGKIIDEMEGTVGIVRGTVEELSNKILNPIRAVSGFLGTIGTFASKKKEDEQTESEVSIEDLLDD